MSSINLANWEEHPTDNRYQVFRFNKDPQAVLFEQYLVKEEIEFVKHVEDETRLFAIHVDDFDRARKLNYLVMAEHREPMIKSGWLRYGFVLFILAAVTIALVGHCKKRVNNTNINDKQLENVQ